MGPRHLGVAVLAVSLPLLGFTACGPSDAEPPIALSDMAGAWRMIVKLQPVTFSPSEPAPEPYYFDLTTNISVTTNAVSVDGFCATPLLLTGLPGRPIWIGSLPLCTFFPVVGCEREDVTLTSLSLWNDPEDKNRIIGEGGGDIAGCGQTRPLLVYVTGVRTTN